MIMTRFKAAALAFAVPGLVVFATPTAAYSGPSAEPTPAVEVFSPEVPSPEVLSHSDRGRHKGWDRGRGHRSHSRASGGRYRGEPVYAHTRIWRGRDGRYYCRKDNGTTGLLIGAAVGGVIGHEVAGYGDRTLGAILGAAGGAILGRAIDRSNSRCR